MQQHLFHENNFIRIISLLLLTFKCSAILKTCYIKLLMYNDFNEF